MKKLSPLFLLCLLLTAGTLKAQHRVVPFRPGISDAQVDASQLLRRQIDLEQGTLSAGAGSSSAAYGIGTAGAAQTAPISDYQVAQTSALGNVVKLSRASNALSSISNRLSQVVTCNDAGLVAFIHRQDIDLFGGGVVENGIYRVDYSTTQGTSSWNLNRGPLNPTPYGHPGRARYPQLALANCSASPADIDFAFVGPMTDGSNWGNYSWGNFTNITSLKDSASTVKQAGVKSKFLSTANNRDVLIPGGLTAGMPGDFWFTDLSYNAATKEYTGKLLIFKGKLDNSTNDVAWTANPKVVDLTSVFERHCKIAKRININGNTNMAFSPDGKYGWIALTGDVIDAPVPGDNTYWGESDLVVLKTTDGGATWSAPQIIKLRNFSSIVDSITTRFDNNVVSSGVPTIGTFDIAVDKNGNPHILAQVINHAVKTCDSLGWVSPGAFRVMVDITTPDLGETWCSKHLAYTNAWQGSVPSATDLGFGSFEQVSRSPDGNIVFFGWVDHNNPNVDPSMMSPDYFGRALRVSDEAMTPLVNYSGTDATWKGKIFYPQTADVFFTTTTTGLNYRVPVVFMQPTGKSDQAVQYWYASGIGFNDADFEAPTNDLAVNDILSPGDVVCQGATLQDVTIEIENKGSGVADSFMVSLVVEGPITTRIDTMLRSVNLAKGAKMNLLFKDVDFSHSGTYSIMATSTFNSDFICANNVAQKTVVAAGGQVGDIFPKTLVGCDSLLLDVGLAGATGAWNGGTVDALQPLMVKVGQVVTVEVNVGGCATLRDTVTITINTSPAITVADTQVCAVGNSAPTVLKADSTGAAQRGYSWDVMTIDGNTPQGPFNANNLSFGTSRGFWIATATVEDLLTGCKARKTVEVKHWNLFTDISSSHNASYCDSAFLSGVNHTTYPGTEYTWYVADTLSSNNSEHMLHKGKHSYKVVATAPLPGCSADSSTAVVSNYDSTYFRSSQFIGYVYTNASRTDSIILSGQVPINSVIRVYADTAARVSDSGRPLTPYTQMEWGIYRSIYFTPGSLKYAPGAEVVQGSTIKVRKSSWIEVSFNQVITTPKMYIDFTIASGKCSTYMKQDFTLKKEITAVGEASALEDLSVYPNPSTGRFNVVGTLARPENVAVRVVDITGRTVHAQNMVNATELDTTLDLSHLPGGVYVLTVQVDGKVTSTRLVKE